MKKIILSTCIAIAISCVIHGVALAAFFDETDGDSWDTAYIIDSFEDWLDFRDVASSPDKYYKLATDLDLVNLSGDLAFADSRGNVFYTGIAFRGYFDGQNHTITYYNYNYVDLYGGDADGTLYYSYDSYDTLEVALFTEVSGGRYEYSVVSEDDILIEEIALVFSGDEEVEEVISSDTVKEEVPVVISGECTPVIKNLNVVGNLSGDCVGTVVHYLYGGVIENCSFNGRIVRYGEDDEYGAGGIVAHMHGGTVTNCRVSADISGASWVGGIVGEMSSGTVQNCTVSQNSKLRSDGYVGGIVGIVGSDDVNLSGNSWNSQQYSEVGNFASSQVVISSDKAIFTWNGHEYQIFDANVTWQQAKSYCESLGGHLLTITSQSEQDEIARMLREVNSGFGYYWLGAKIDSGGMIEWVTDEVFEKQFRNFAENHPNGSGNYLQILADSGKWIATDNLASEFEHGFICEWDTDQNDAEEAPVSDAFQDWLEHRDELDETKSTGAIPSPNDMSHLSSNPPKTEVSSDLPKFYRNEKLPAVRDQGKFLTCWAFAAIGAMEADYMKQNLTIAGAEPDFSELHLAWFAFKDASSDNFGKGNKESILMSCGMVDTAESFLAKFPNTVNESVMQYSVAGTDSRDADSKIESFLGGKRAEDLPSSRVLFHDTLKFGNNNYLGDENIKFVKQAIIDHGAVFCIFYNHDDVYYNESHDAFYTNNNLLDKLHAVLLVGWDDDYPLENFNPIKPSQNGAWLVRNSEGVNKNDNGYFWMSYEQATVNQSGIRDITAFIVSEDTREDDTLITNYHDENGKTKHISTTWSSNIFKSSRNESLVRIGFHTTDNNTRYKIFVNNFGKIRPTDPGHAENAILTGEIPNAGYHTLDLPETVNLYSGDYYAVIIQSTLSSDYEFPTGVEASISNYVRASVNQGESFFAVGDPVPSVWYDGTEINGGPYNATIKAFTLERFSNETAPEITSENLPDATVGIAYSYTLTASGTAPIEWRSGNIPDGLSLTQDGILSGTPKEAGEYEIAFTVLNNVDQSGKTFTLKIAGASSNNPTSNGGGGGSSCNSGDLGLVFAILLAVFTRFKSNHIKRS